MTSPYPEWLVVSAVRYALGRASYVVGECCAWLAGHWEDLDEPTRHVVRLDVERALAGGALPDSARAEWQALADRVGRAGPPAG